MNLSIYIIRNANLCMRACMCACISVCAHAIDNIMCASIIILCVHVCYQLGSPLEGLQCHDNLSLLCGIYVMMPISLWSVPSLSL